MCSGSFSNGPTVHLKGIHARISSVNNVTNAEYYVDNPSQTGVCINGYTSPITAKEAVQCGEVYHIRLAIADMTESFVKFTSENPCILDCTDDTGAWHMHQWNIAGRERSGMN